MTADARDRYQDAVRKTIEGLEFDSWWARALRIALTAATLFVGLTAGVALIAMTAAIVKSMF